MEIKKRKTRMYEPWGYQEENNYQSDENILIGDLDSFFSDATYKSDDKKIHFFNRDGEEKVTIDVTEFSSSVIESTSYDSTTKILTIVFSNGDVIEINLADLIDENEFGNGLQVNGGIVSVLVDSSGESYLSVSENGIKLSGVDAAINVETERAISAETQLQTAIDVVDSKVDSEIERAISAETQLQTTINNEIERATSAETILQTAINNEVSRAQNEENTLNTKISNEITRATQTEHSLDSRITLVNDELDAEESIREANDVRLEASITQETNRAVSAETVITNKITELVEELQPLINETLETTNNHEVAFGQYNISRTGDELADKTILTVGYGTSDSDRKNLFEIRANGDTYMWIEGDYINVNNILSMLTNEVYDDDSGT